MLLLKVALEESSGEPVLVNSELFEREQILSLTGDSKSLISYRCLQRDALAGIQSGHLLSKVLGEARKVVLGVEARELGLNLTSTLLATHPSSLSRRDQ